MFLKTGCMVCLIAHIRHYIKSKNANFGNSLSQMSMIVLNNQNILLMHRLAIKVNNIGHNFQF